VRRSLIDLVGTCRNRVVIACFASNVARLESAAVAAAANDRHVALIGRSLWRIAETARECGYLQDVPDFLTEDEAGFLPREKVVLVCTGSQGEGRSALVRIAGNEHAHIVLERGDTAIFSSRVIPGNERAVGRLQNALIGLGVELVTDHDHFVHVSGHPAQDELQRMYQAVRPRIAVPVHGEARHLLAQARLAEGCHVAQAIVTRNGEVVKLAPGPAAVIGAVPTGRLVADGKQLLDAAGEVFKSRQRVIFNGAALVTIVLDGNGLVMPPQVTVPGLAGGEAELTLDLGGAVAEAIDAMPARERRDDEAVREVARIALRRAVRARFGKRPVTEVHLVRLDGAGRGRGA
jgi:ribonuclease J